MSIHGVSGTGAFILKTAMGHIELEMLTVKIDQSNLSENLIIYNKRVDMHRK